MSDAWAQVALATCLYVRELALEKITGKIELL